MLDRVFATQPELPDRVRRGAYGPDRGAMRGRRGRLPLLGRRALPHGRGDHGGRRRGRRLASGVDRGGVRNARGGVDHRLANMTAVFEPAMYMRPIAVYDDLEPSVPPWFDALTHRTPGSHPLSFEASSLRLAI